MPWSCNSAVPSSIAISTLDNLAVTIYINAFNGINGFVYEQQTHREKDRERGREKGKERKRAAKHSKMTKAIYRHNNKTESTDTHIRAHSRMHSLHVLEQNKHSQHTRTWTKEAVLRENGRNEKGK